MENPYEGQYYQPYTPQSEPKPAPNVYNGNAAFGTASLIMGILSLITLCCFAPAFFIFAGLGILFSCLSKGQYTRPGSAKAGMAISVSGIVLVSAFFIIISAVFLSTDTGRRFFRDYMYLITSDNATDEDLYNFVYKYLYEFYGYDTDYYSLPDSAYPYGGDEYIDDYYDYYYDYGDDNDGYFYGDDLPDFYMEPDIPSDNGSNLI